MSDYQIFINILINTLLSRTQVGNLYIADANNNRIRKVTALTGIITTIAGNGTMGFGGDGGLATVANLNSPRGITFDVSGNLYFSDASNNRIRKITADSGIISTVAGNGIQGLDGDGGLANAASLKVPIGIVFDKLGNLFIADNANSRIRKVSANTNIISTVAGNSKVFFGGDSAAATSAYLYYPSGITFDKSGNLFIADCYNNRIRKVSAATGFITTLAGNGTKGYSGDGGAATSASLYYPSSLVIDDSGNLIFTDARNNRVRKVSAVSGIITTIAGNGTASFGGDGGIATEASLYAPSGLAIDASGNLYIADASNNRIRKVEQGTGIISTIAGNGKGSFGGDGGEATAASIYNPIGLAFDIAGNLYIAEYGNHRIRKVSALKGIISTVAGNGIGTFGIDGGIATSSSIYNPSGIALDSIGNLYIADLGNNRVRKVSSVTGIISTVAGNGIAAFGGDGGTATSANLNAPINVALDGKGNLFIADNINSRIRKVSFNTSGINEWEIGFKKSFKIYPNPATSELHVETEGSDKLSLQFFDITGKAATPSFEFVHSTSIHTQDLHEGIYFLKITDENGTFVKTEKVMVLR